MIALLEELLELLLLELPSMSFIIVFWWFGPLCDDNLHCCSGRMENHRFSFSIFVDENHMLFSLEGLIFVSMKVFFPFFGS